MSWLGWSQATHGAWLWAAQRPRQLATLGPARAQDGANEEHNDISFFALTVTENEGNRLNLNQNGQLQQIFLDKQGG